MDAVNDSLSTAIRDWNARLEVEPSLVAGAPGRYVLELEGSENVACVDGARALVVAGQRDDFASCHARLRLSGDTFSRVLAGAETLADGFASGAVSVSGEADSVMIFSALLDRLLCAPRARMQ